MLSSEFDDAKSVIVVSVLKTGVKRNLLRKTDSEWGLCLFACFSYVSLFFFVCLSVYQFVYLSVCLFLVFVLLFVKRDLRRRTGSEWGLCLFACF